MPKMKSNFPGLETLLAKYPTQNPTCLWVS